MAPPALRELTAFIFYQIWLKLANNLTWFKVGYDETMGLYFMSSGTEIGYKVKVGELNWHHDMDKPTKWHTVRTADFYFLDSFPLFLCPSASILHGSPALYTNFLGSSLKCQIILHRRQGIKWIVLEFDSIQKISDGLKKSPGILPCITFIPRLL